MTKLSESIIGRIKNERIAPVPRWHFLFKSYAFWALFGFSMILGSLSFSVIMHIANSGDLGMLAHLQGNLLTSVFMLLPYFWLFSLAVFAFVAYFNVRFTKQGYRFRRRWIMLGSVGLSVFFGSIFYALGLGNQIDSAMAKTVPFYDVSKHKARTELWLQPEIGLIMGKVIKFDDVSKQLTIQDELGKNWEVEENVIKAKISEPIVEGKIIKIIGKKRGTNTFIADEIRRCSDCQDDEDSDSEDDGKSDTKEENLRISENDDENIKDESRKISNEDEKSEGSNNERENELEKR
jgi:hypothetical protein